MDTLKILDRTLSVLENDVLPLTVKGTNSGNKVFGAAILRKSDLSLVIAGTNEETINPLYHGEISCLNKFWALPEEQRPDPQECLFLSSHEPCSLCLSAITWSGFNNFYYLFSYEDSRDEFNIPHDLNILKEVFKCNNGEYNPSNFYWESHYLPQLIETQNGKMRDKLNKRVLLLREKYQQVSEQYQLKKEDQNIPLD